MTSEAREQEIALMEAHMIGFADAYFAARNPMLDTADRRRVFEAGFKAAWSDRTAAIEAARVEAEKLREELARTERNRDMWKEQCAQQARQLESLHMSLAANIRVAEHMEGAAASMARDLEAPPMGREGR